ncbi:MAG: DUF4271 domain-containing protein [Flavisolibacter sp.]
MKYLFFIFFILIVGDLFAQDSIPPPPPPDPPQVTDTPTRSIVVTKPRPVRRVVVPKKDSTIIPADTAFVKNDSIQKANRPVMLADTLLLFPSWASPGQRSFFRFSDPLEYSITEKQWQGKEKIFYAIIALLIFFALIKNGFQRYLVDLFRTFFRTTVKQRQVKEQLLQSPLPSLLLNIFFLISGGLFLALLFEYFRLASDLNFWILFLYCMAGLVSIYGIKYLTLKLLGWIFQVSEVIDGYIFIVFTTNKIIGIAVLPFVVILAFSYGFINEIALNLSIVVIASLFAYRFFLSYVSLRKQVNISFFHFFLYLCAFEIAPLLLINKLLFRFLQETT